MKKKLYLVFKIYWWGVSSLIPVLPSRHFNLIQISNRKLIRFTCTSTQKTTSYVFILNDNLNMDYTLARSVNDLSLKVQVSAIWVTVLFFLPKYFN